MLKYNNESGQIEKFEGPSEIWCIFLYDSIEDKNNVVGKCPLIYKTYDDLVKYRDSQSGKRDFKEWESENKQIVIRPIYLYNS